MAKTAFDISLRQLKALDPCADRYRAMAEVWPKGKRLTAREAVALGATLDDMVWLASAITRKDKAIERRLRHWMADCAAHVLHIYENHYPDDLRPRRAIEAARMCADGKITDAAWSAARAAARDAARDAAGAAAGDAAGAAAWSAAWSAAWDAARDAAGDAAGAAAWSAAGAAAWDAARDAAGAAAGAAARDAARAAAEEYQLGRLILWLSVQEPDPIALPERQKDAA